MATVIIDCESGNLHSAHKAFERMARETGAGEIRVSSDPEEVRRASRVVLPGDGAFPACRKALFDHRGLFEAMHDAVVAQGRPFMGICIGMQLMATRGTEHAETPGFGWIGGTVEAIRPEGGLKVPHMGWNDLRILHPHPALKGSRTAITPTSSTPTICAPTIPAGCSPRPTMAAPSPRSSGATTSSAASSTPRRARPRGCGSSPTSSPGRPDAAPRMRAPARRRPP